MFGYTDKLTRFVLGAKHAIIRRSIKLLISSLPVKFTFGVNHQNGHFFNTKDHLVLFHKEDAVIILKSVAAI